MVDLQSWYVRQARSIADRGRQVAADSHVCRFFRLTARSLDARSSFIGHLLSRRAPPSEFELVAHLVTRSTGYQFVHRVAQAGRAAWASSVAARLYADHVYPLDAQTRLRLLAWTILLAAVVRALADFRGLTSSRAALGSWGLVVVVSLVALARPARIARWFFAVPRGR